MLSLARAGRGGLVLDTGPPGLGKTALLRELAATSEKAASWWATAGELEDQAPFGVVRQLLDRTLRECPEAERSGFPQDQRGPSSTTSWADRPDRWTRPRCSMA